MLSYPKLRIFVLSQKFASHTLIHSHAPFALCQDVVLWPLELKCKLRDVI